MIKINIIQMNIKLYIIHVIQAFLIVRHVQVKEDALNVRIIIFLLMKIGLNASMKLRKKIL